MPDNDDPKPIVDAKRISLSFDYRTLAIAVLVVIIAVMLVIWKPWETSAKASDRTVSVTGQATLTAVPDEYIFSPSYDSTNSDKTAALAELTQKSSDITAKLKSLGVTSNQIKTNTTGGGGGVYYPMMVRPDGTSTYTLSFTITVNSLSLAQTVQDYLATTTPTGDVSPQADFSTAKRLSLESQARDLATKDARAKANQSAQNLGFKLGAVKSVSDDAGFGGPIEAVPGVMSNGANSAAPVKLDVQPGENSLDYSVSVVYYLK